MGNLCSKSERGNEAATKYSEGTRTKQYDIFRRQFDKLVTVVEPNVEEVARKALAKNLVDHSALKAASNQYKDTDVRANKLLSDILGKIEEKAEHFDTFTEILVEIPTCKDMADELVRLLSGVAQQETQQGSWHLSRLRANCMTACNLMSVLHLDVNITSQLKLFIRVSHLTCR